MGTGNKEIVVKKYMLRNIRHALEECAVLTEDLTVDAFEDQDVENVGQAEFPLHITCLGLIQYIGELTKEVE
tara:strand:+ start:160 stop:375 length:216 start_codon:yes stop_codon:yes gene_type:complete